MLQFSDLKWEVSTLFLTANAWVACEEFRYRMTLGGFGENHTMTKKKHARFEVKKILPWHRHRLSSWGHRCVGETRTEEKKWYQAWDLQVATLPSRCCRRPRRNWAWAETPRPSLACGCWGVAARSAPAPEPNQGLPEINLLAMLLWPNEIHLVGTLREPVDHLQGTLPGDHRSKAVTKLKGVLAQVFDHTVAPVDYWEQAPASWMGEVMDLSHNLDYGLVQGNLWIWSTRQRVTRVLKIDQMNLWLFQVLIF